jgi:hypothetical protein
MGPVYSSANKWQQRARLMRRIEYQAILNAADTDGNAATKAEAHRAMADIHAKQGYPGRARTYSRTIWSVDSQTSRETTRPNTNESSVKTVLLAKLRTRALASTRVDMRLPATVVADTGH